MSLSAQEQQALIAANMKLARAIAAKIARDYPGHDAFEMESRAYDGLMKAAASYDPESGKDFKAYAAAAIRNAIEDGKRKEARTIGSQVSNKADRRATSFSSKSGRDIDPEGRSESPGVTPEQQRILDQIPKNEPEKKHDEKFLRHVENLKTQSGKEGSYLNKLGAEGRVPFYEPRAAMTQDEIKEAITRPALPMPGVEPGSQLEKQIKPAWDIVSRLWPEMAGKIPNIRHATAKEIEKTRNKRISAAINSRTGELILPDNEKALSPKALWHELVHVGHREEGQLEGYFDKEKGDITESGRLVESEAEQRAMQAQDYLIRRYKETLKGMPPQEQQAAQSVAAKIPTKPRPGRGAKNTAGKLPVGNNPKAEAAPKAGGPAAAETLAAPVQEQAASGGDGESPSQKDPVYAGKLPTGEDAPAGTKRPRLGRPDLPTDVPANTDSMEEAILAVGRETPGTPEYKVAVEKVIKLAERFGISFDPAPTSDTNESVTGESTPSTTAAEPTTPAPTSDAVEVLAAEAAPTPSPTSETAIPSTTATEPPAAAAKAPKPKPPRKPRAKIAKKSDLAGPPIPQGQATSPDLSTSVREGLPPGISESVTGDDWDKRESELRAAHGKLPKLEDGRVRFYHGGMSERGDLAKELFGRSADYTHDFEYALGYARKAGPQASVWHFDADERESNVLGAENFFGADALVMDKTPDEQFRILHDPEWLKEQGIPPGRSYSHLSPTEEQYARSQSLISDSSETATTKTTASPSAETSETVTAPEPQASTASSPSSPSADWGEDLFAPHQEDAANSDVNDAAAGQAKASGQPQGKQPQATVSKLGRMPKGSDLGGMFAKAGASFLGRRAGEMLGKSGLKIPREFAGPLMQAGSEAISSMFGGGGGGEAGGGVPSFGEGDAAVSADGGGGDSTDTGDISAKLDRIIELLSQLVQASGKGEGPAGPQAPNAAGDIAQNLARQVGGAAAGAAASATGADSNKNSSSDDMMNMLLQTLVRAAVTAVTAL